MLCWELFCIGLFSGYRTLRGAGDTVPTPWVTDGEPEAQGEEWFQCVWDWNPGCLWPHLAHCLWVPRVLCQHLLSSLPLKNVPPGALTAVLPLPWEAGRRLGWERGFVLCVRGCSGAHGGKGLISHEGLEGPARLGTCPWVATVGPGGKGQEELESSHQCLPGPEAEPLGSDFKRDSSAGGSPRLGLGRRSLPPRSPQ